MKGKKKTVQVKLGFPMLSDVEKIKELEDYDSIVSRSSLKWVFVGIGAFILSAWLSQSGEVEFTRLLSYFAMVGSLIMIGIHLRVLATNNKACYG